MKARTPRGMRLHIGIFGRRNVGKSSILNCLTEQDTAIVSHHAGTTTDPVEKNMELQPIGPVLFVDTAGIDDVGALGQRRIKKTRDVLRRTDFALLVTDSAGICEFEKELIAQFENLDIPFVMVINKSDVAPPDEGLITELRQKDQNVCITSTETKEGIDELRDSIIRSVPENAIVDPAIVNDLIPKGSTVILVVPVDKEAPKGRLILPQAQVIRDLLDGNCIALVCQDSELAHSLSMLREKPSLVVTDSQAFAKVAADTPDDIPMTSFSILFARFKGDLHELARGAMTIDSLSPGDRIMIAESCTHHPIEDDIGTEKIPRWLQRHLGGDLRIDHYRGNDFPDDLEKYKLIIHCGSCMWNRRQMLSRISMAKQASVPITNYGMTIAYLHGIFDRALAPFSEVDDLMLRSS